MSTLDQKTIEKMNLFANGFASERVEQELDKIEAAIKGSNGGFVYSRAQIKKDIGRMLATAYVKGYADAHENIDVKRLIF